MKTLLITGASSGIGKETAKYFASKGWNVAATMRNPEKETELTTIPNIKIFQLDVVNEKSIQLAMDEAIKEFGKIDVVVNNAGYALVGAFEAMSQEQLKRQFDTNVLGAMSVIKIILPHFREQRNGTIINISSMGGRITFPLFSAYHGTKWALEGFSESLQYELRPFNIKVKTVEPGAIKTDFYDRSLDFVTKENLTAYDHYVNKVHANMLNFGKQAVGPNIVAKKIFQAANDTSFRLRYPIGSGAPILLFLRWILPLSWFNKLVAMQVEK